MVSLWWRVCRHQPRGVDLFVGARHRVGGAVGTEGLKGREEWSARG